MDSFGMQFRAFLSRHNEFIGNVARLMSGKAVAGMIAILTMPIVARLFDPSDFGVAALFLSIIGIISSVAALRYESALVLPKEEQDAHLLIALTYRLLLSASAMLLIFIALYELGSTSLPALELLGRWIWLLPLGVLLATAIIIQEQWLTRRKAFAIQASSLVAGNVGTSAARICFGVLLGSSAGGLIGGHFIGMVLRLAAHRSVGAMGLRAGFSRTKWPALRTIAIRYSDFPKFNAPAGLIYTTGQRLPVLLFAGMFSPAIAGFYAMAQQVSRTPVTIVSDSMRRVFMQKAASIINRGGNLKKAFLLATGGLAVLGLPFLAVMAFFGEPLLTWFLGKRWSTAGQYLEIMAPWLFMIWVMAPCNPIFVVLRKQRFWLSLQVLLTTLRLASFGVAYVLAAHPDWTLKAFVIATITSNLVTMSTAYILIRQHSAMETANSQQQE